MEFQKRQCLLLFLQNKFSLISPALPSKTSLSRQLFLISIGTLSKTNVTGNSIYENIQKRKQLFGWLINPYIKIFTLIWTIRIKIIIKVEKHATNFFVLQSLIKMCLVFFFDEGNPQNLQFSTQIKKNLENYKNNQNLKPLLTDIHNHKILYRLDRRSHNEKTSYFYSKYKGKRLNFYVFPNKSFFIS